MELAPGQRALTSIPWQALTPGGSRRELALGPPRSPDRWWPMTSSARKDQTCRRRQRPGGREEAEEVTPVDPRSPGEDLEGAQRTRAHTMNVGTRSGSQTAQVQVSALPLTGCTGLDRCVAFTCFPLHKMGIIPGSAMQSYHED